jgi:phenylalanine-4-hydroxylase
VIERFEDLLRQTLETDFAPLYRELEGAPDIKPGEVIAADQLISIEDETP